MKTCIFITGTNCSGKTSVAKELINRFGGYGSTTKWLTTCVDPRYAVAGKYGEERKHGGVDCWSQTKCLEGVVRNAFGQGVECIFCEGSYLDTFGLNATNAMFVADRHLVVLLVAPLEVIARRLATRTGSEITKEICKKQGQAINASKKWVEIGVPVIVFNTAENSTEHIADEIIKRL